MNIAHNLYLQATTAQNNVRVTLTAPTGNPHFYNLPSIQTPVSGKYGARLSISSKFNLKNDCNPDGVTNRQCQLHCRREYLLRTRPTCRPVSLNGHILGTVLPDGPSNACMIDAYMNDSASGNDREFTACTHRCQPPCTYILYEFWAMERTGVKNGTLLISPIGDYPEFEEQPAYTWIKVLADCGGLM